MNKSIDITFKLIIAFIAFYIFSRFIIPYIVQLINDKKKKNSNSAKSLDQMIREKEILLRNGMKRSASPTQSNNLSKKDLSVDELLSRYKGLTNKSTSNNEDIDPMIDLLENLQWGESKASKKIIDQAMNEYGISIEGPLINRVIKDNFRLNFFQELPTFTIITDYLISYGIIQSFFNKENSLKMAHSIIRGHPLLLPQFVIKGAHILIVKNDLGSNFDENKYNNILLPDSPVYKKSIDSQKTSISNTIFSLGETRTIAPKFLIEKILSQSMIVMAVTPINISEKITKQEAMNLFNLTNNNCLNIDEIKKTYKKFAQICHPDKLIGEKLPKELMENAQRNFIIVKNSFDILKKELKDS